MFKKEDLYPYMFVFEEKPLKPVLRGLKGV